VGTIADVALWHSDSFGFLRTPFLSDRVPIANSDKEAGIIAGGRNNNSVILTPEAAPQ
jgi:hypothetical protein